MPRERAKGQDWELSLLDPEDPDERAILIRLAHPELDDAIASGLEEVAVAGEPMKPRLHLAIHEIVATQIVDDDPPEVFATSQRLLALGNDPHEVLHMLGSAVAAQLSSVHKGHAGAREEHLRALAALPNSWHEQHVGRAGPQHQNHPGGRDDVVAAEPPAASRHVTVVTGDPWPRSRTRPVQALKFNHDRS